MLSLAANFFDSDRCSAYTVQAPASVTRTTYFVVPLFNGDELGVFPVAYPN